MRNMKSLTFYFVTLMTVLIISMLTLFGVNFYKLTKCDFKSDYKCEIIHGAGLIPPLSIFTVWFGVDSK